MFRFFENLVDPYVVYKENDAPPQRLTPFLLEYARPFAGIFWLTGLMSVIVASVEIYLLYYLGRLVDVMGDSTPGSFWQTHGFELIIVAIFILTLRPALGMAQVALLNNTILPNIGTMVRWRAHRHVLRQSVGWFENDFAGRIANRIMQTPPAVGEVVFQIFDAITFALAYLIGALVLLGEADVRLIVPMLAWFVPYLFLLRWVIKQVAPASQAASDARSAVTGRVVDSYTNIHSVKMFAHHDREVDYAKEAIETARKTFQVEMRLFSIMDLALILLNGILVVGVVGYAIFLWTQEAASLGVVAAASALTLRLNGMSGWIMWAVSNFFRNLGVVAEGMETIAQPVTLLDKPGAKPLEVRAGKVEIKELSHHYGKKKGGLDRINLTIPAGQKVGLVGQSGAGKSTLVKLFLRFYDAELGEILIDGQNTQSVTQDSLRSAIGMVQQDSALLHRSVRENIAYGNPDASDDQIIAAAKKAQAHEFIQTLEDAEGNKGYASRVGERGVKLSGGQRQRIALARVMLKDAPILMLDEATSALDSEVEAAIQDTLSTMMEGKTVIAIAHRLSTIAQMDRIIVLENGRIIEDGDHQGLLEANGQYARFWARQSGGFLGQSEAAE
ncbi:ATP-binding cassette, subfamily B, multidrug efflux pump [Cognatiyoonia koreensis]|uniref:ATP-binding cassette, subfamily B, multidrug efflux pump n=1 Tax=Cognatiyoonia koreensis TaxID=364200 RepID=A0A1I0RNT0_9RHOB|nr:ABC transporter ATP-binding protein [Cognatiyoonia koreensis]SEW42871.1 ATP-binding cassette, subfamily B, multidrug efflux pump [Cognatiyoonia koreensis]